MELSAEYKPTSPHAPVLFSQGRLSDLVRDLRLSVNNAELLAFRLQESKLLKISTRVTFYRTQNDEHLSFFMNLTVHATVVMYK